MGIREIIRVQIYAVIVLVGSTGLFAGLGKNDQEADGAHLPGDGRALCGNEHGEGEEGV